MFDISTFLLVIHILIAVALIGVVLLQRSEGGALGIGGGGGGGGFMSGRGAANVLTRTTAILAAAFFVTSIGLTILARQETGEGSVTETISDEDLQLFEAPGTEEDDTDLGLDGLPLPAPVEPTPPAEPELPRPE